MELLATFAVAVGLAMDAFAVSLGLSTAGQTNELQRKFRLAFHFGFFQGMMTALGWFAGSKIASMIGGVDHWIAMILLGYIGIKMIITGVNPTPEKIHQVDPTRGLTLVILAVATSIDALAVGLSLAMLGEAVLIPALIIGIVTFVLSGIALFAGDRLGVTFGKRMEIVGGLILILIGLRIFITHILA